MMDQSTSDLHPGDVLVAFDPASPDQVVMLSRDGDVYRLIAEDRSAHLSRRHCED